MPRAAVLALALGLGAAARAETVVPPAEFEAMAEGRTLHFSFLGAAFGAEQFLPGRRTIWRFADASCDAGRWRPEGEAICFTYETLEGPICWRFLDLGGARYAAELLEGGRPADFRLELERIDADPVPCPGPKVGS
jgi:hypothetical protein